MCVVCCVLCCVLCALRCITTPKQALNKVGAGGSGDEQFTATDKVLGEFIASVAGQILQNARLYNEAVRRRKEQAALLAIMKTAEFDADVETVIETILNVCYDILDCERVRGMK